MKKHEDIPHPSNEPEVPSTEAEDEPRSLIKVPKRLIGESLVEAGLINQEHLTLALDEQRITGERIGDILLRLGLVRADQVNQLMAWRAGVDVWDPKKDPVDQGLFLFFPQDLMVRHCLIPVRRNEREFLVATPRVSDSLVRFDVERAITGRVRFLYAPEHQVSAILSAGLKRSEGGLPAYAMMGPSETGIPDEGIVVELVDAIFRRAVSEDATDIHFEPEDKVFRIRERIDGILHHRLALPRSLHPPVVTRIKIMAGLDITESRLPQDGKIRFALSPGGDEGKGAGMSALEGSPLNLPKGPSVDIRVSTFLTNRGENVACRMLQPARMVLELADLGLDGENLIRVQRALEAPHGMILVSGPTGSGKTTTLYSIIAKLYPLDKNIMTVEDPIEIDLPLIRQSQVNLKAGLTFSAGLRAILRQDPDVILVGEIRDAETAEIGLRAALTGHLLFSTLHTNDALSVVARLRQLGLAPFLIASSLLLVVAQRLVRKICERCRVEELPEENVRAFFDPKILDEIRFYKGKGCEVCSHTGYRGRIGIFEILTVDRLLRNLIQQEGSMEEMEVTAHQGGFTTLREDALSKVRQGITTLDEVVRVTVERE